MSVSWVYVCLGLTIIMNAFFLAEILHKPAILLCDCRAHRRWHLDDIPLFMMACIASAVSVIYTMLSVHFNAVVYAAIAALYFHFWWVHSKNKRKKLKDKILGVVKVTAAGLKVEPTSA